MNVSPVSKLSSDARKATRESNHTISTAESKSTDCSYEISTKSEAVSGQIYANLNTCMSPGGVWLQVEIPEFGPNSDVTTQTPSTPEKIESTLEPTPTSEKSSTLEPSSTLDPNSTLEPTPPSEPLPES